MVRVIKPSGGFHAIRGLSGTTAINVKARSRHLRGKWWGTRPEEEEKDGNEEEEEKDGKEKEIRPLRLAGLLEENGAGRAVQPSSY